MRTTRRRLLHTSALLAGGGLASTGLASAGGDELTAQAKDVLSWQPHIDVPGYNYVGSVARGEFCYWATSACIHLAALSAFAAGPETAVVIGSACAAEASACRLLDDLERLTPYDFSWVHVYGKERWLQGYDALPGWIVIPEPQFDDTSDAKMVAEVIAGDDGKIDTGELLDAMDYWSSGKTVPGTDHKVTTATLTLLIKFWGSGNAVT